MTKIPKSNNSTKTFLAVNFGCRVNSAETNLFSQKLVNMGFTPSDQNQIPSIIFINTCSITQKGEYESLAKVRHLHQLYPKAKIVVSGCADVLKINDIPNLTIYSNKDKEMVLEKLYCQYSRSIKDKFSKSDKFLLKIQSGCNRFCTYCTVPLKRNYLWSLPIDRAIASVNNAVSQGYREIIITGVNIDMYQYDLIELLKSILNQTKIEKISFGSLPINSINDNLVRLFKNHKNRFKKFLHIPIQSGSNKILKMMNRPYTKEKIISTINHLRLSINNIELGTDIIVGFPGETENDFLETYNLCKEIGFTKIHTFRYSERPGTQASTLFHQLERINGQILLKRSQKIRSLI